MDAMDQTECKRPRLTQVLEADDATAEDVNANESSTIEVTPRENDFSERTWWMVDLNINADNDYAPSNQGATALVKRFMRVHECDLPRAREILNAYRQFLTLKKDHEDWDATLLSPPYWVDQMWHLHIMDITNYCHDMMLLCGHFVGYDPDGVFDRKKKKKRDSFTKKVIGGSFAQYDEEIWDFDDDDDDDYNDDDDEDGDDKDNVAHREDDDVESSTKEGTTIPSMIQVARRTKKEVALNSSTILITPRKNDFSKNTWWMVDVNYEDYYDLHDYSPIKQGATLLMKRCMREHGWCLSFAQDVLVSYREFLTLKKELMDWDGTLLSPSPSVDEMWRLHVLDNTNYCHDMMLLCGHVVGLHPDDVSDKSGMEVRRTATKTALKKRFGHYNPLIWEQDDQRIQIFVKSLDGKTLSFCVTPSFTTCSLKHRICREEGIATAGQRIIFAGRQLEDGRTLQYYNITDESSLHLLVRRRRC